MSAKVFPETQSYNAISPLKRFHYRYGTLKLKDPRYVKIRQITDLS